MPKLHAPPTGHGSSGDDVGAGKRTKKCNNDDDHDDGGNGHCNGNNSDDNVIEIGVGH